MADQHTQTNGAGKDTGTTPKPEAAPNTDLNQSIAPAASNWDENPFALPPMENAAAPVTSGPAPTSATPEGSPIPSPEASGLTPPPTQPPTSTTASPAGDEPEGSPTSASAGVGSAPTSAAATLENFHKEMKWERHGYRPVAYFNTVEDARTSRHDLSKTEAYVSVKHGGFTAEELAAIPDNAKQKNYYIGFAKQMLDSSEGIFTKKFWTSFDGIKKVLTAGIIKGEVEEVRLEAAEWLLSKRGGAAPETPASPESGPTSPKATPTPDKDSPKEASASPAPSAPEATSSPETTPTPAKEGAEPSSESRALIVPPVVEGEVITPESTTTRKATPSSVDAPVIDVDVIETPTKKDADKESHATSAPVESPTPSSVVENKERVVETKTLDISALQEIEKRVQEKLEALRGRIVPETITVRLDDPKSAQTVRQLQRYGEGFNAGFAAQTSKVHEAIDAIGKLGLDQPQQAIVFKRRQEEALALVDSLTFGQSELGEMAKNIKVPRGNKLPDSMKEAMANSSDILEGIKNDLEEARRLIANARRTNPAAKAEQDVAAQPSADVKTGSVATMPRLGKDLTIDPRKLEAMGHAMVDANISDKDLNGWYKMVMSEFVKSYVGTFSNIRKEIYQSRMDGSNMTEMQKEKFRYLADELGQEVKVSDLVQLDYSKFSLPFTEELDSRFRRVIDGSKFQKALNQMKAEFAAALTKELDKEPGAENTDTTYVAFKRDKYEKTKGFLAFEEAEKAIG